MYKIILMVSLAVALLLVLARPHFTPEPIQASTSGLGLKIALDPVTGEMRRPNAVEMIRSKNSIANQPEKELSIEYRNTLKIHPDGTRTGVVDPSFQHTIFATRDADGNLVFHEGEHPSSTEALEEQ